MTITRTLVLIVALTATAHADDIAAAAQAFSQAQAAMMANDVAGAADLYELADSLAPSAPALRNAARARLAAGHIAAAATWAVEILRRYPNDKESRDIADAILAKLTPQLASIEVRCSAPCKLLVDGKALFAKPRDQYSLFTVPGARSIAAVYDGERRAEKQITAKLGATAIVALPVPAAASTRTTARRDTPHRGGISKWWTITGGVATLGLGGVAAWSGLQTLHTRDDIAGARGTPSATALYDRGVTEQRRTNILLGATAAVGVATVACAIFTNWHGAEHVSIEANPAHDSASATIGYRGSF